SRLQQAPARLQIGEEAVHFSVAIQTRQLLNGIVGEEIHLGGSDCIGVMHAVLEAVERGALGAVAHDGLRARRFAEAHAAPMASEKQIALGLRFAELLFEFQLIETTKPSEKPNRRRAFGLTQGRKPTPQIPAASFARPGKETRFSATALPSA